MGCEIGPIDNQDFLGYEIGPVDNQYFLGCEIGPAYRYFKKNPKTTDNGRLTISNRCESSSVLTALATQLGTRFGMQLYMGGILSRRLRDDG